MPKLLGWRRLTVLCAFLASVLLGLTRVTHYLSLIEKVLQDSDGLRTHQMNVPVLSIDTLCEECKAATVGHHFSCVNRMMRWMGSGVSIKEAQNIISSEYSECSVCNPSTCLPQLLSASANGFQIFDDFFQKEGNSSEPSSSKTPIIPTMTIETLCEECKAARVGRLFTCVDRIKRYMHGNSIFEQAQKIVSAEYEECSVCSPTLCRPSTGSIQHTGTDSPFISSQNITKNSMPSLSLENNDSPDGLAAVVSHWWRRQENIAEGLWGNSSATFLNATTYSRDMAVLTPSMMGSCRTLQKQLNWEGACESLSHRQKTPVSLVVDDWMAPEMQLERYDCALSQCSVQAGHGHTTLTHVFLTTGRASQKYNESRHVNAVMNLESLPNSELKTPLTSGADWLVSHRQDGFPADRWVPISYITADAALFRITGLTFAERRNQIPIFVSSCKSHTHRDLVISELAQYLSIESFGRCSFQGVEHSSLQSTYPLCAKQPRLSAMRDAVKECVMFHAKFTLVLENTFEEGYLTEKLWQPLKMGAIPILPGNASLVRPFLPSANAAIFLQDFGNYQEAARYILDVAQNETLWKHHTEWKHQPFSKSFTGLVRHSFGSLACELCDKYARLNHQATGPSLDVVPPCALTILDRAMSIPDQLPPMNPIYGLDAVFITHYTPLKERRIIMQQRVQEQFGIDPVFVTDFDREVLSEGDLECLSDRATQTAFIHRHTKTGEDSLTMKHMAVYWHMVKHSLQNVLVLEDDATFVHSDWRSKDSMWQSILRDLPADYDMLFLSGCCNIHNRGKKITEYLYLAQESRVSSMYLVSNKGARNMLRTLPIVAPIDFQVNYAGGWTNSQGSKGRRDVARPPVEDLKVYHSEPYMSDQVDPSNHARTVMDRRS